MSVCTIENNCQFERAKVRGGAGAAGHGVGIQGKARIGGARPASTTSFRLFDKVLDVSHTIRRWQRAARPTSRVDVEAECYLCVAILARTMQCTKVDPILRAQDALISVSSIYWATELSRIYPRTLPSSSYLITAIIASASCDGCPSLTSSMRPNYLVTVHGTQRGRVRPPRCQRCLLHDDLSGFPGAAYLHLPS
jgi:hypothetical protein